MPLCDSYAQYLGVKYLTDPKAFPLQLKDFKFRQQVACQFLIACQAVRDLSTRKSDKAQSEGGTMIKGSPVLDKLVKGVENRSFKVIEQSPNGGELSGAIKDSLWKEMKWREWKLEKKCKSFAKKSAPIPEPVLSDKVRNIVKANEMYPDSDYSRSWTSMLYFDKDMDAVKEQLSELAANVPSYEAHIEEYKDAEDPENGIEEEYHPKHNASYLWRARRLLVNKNLDAFTLMSDGDISKALAYDSLPKKDMKIQVRSRILVPPVEKVEKHVGDEKKEEHSMDIAAMGSAIEAGKAVEKNKPLEGTSSNDSGEKKAQVDDNKAKSSNLEEGEEQNNVSVVPSQPQEKEKEKEKKEKKLRCVKVFNLPIEDLNESSWKEELTTYFEEFSKVKTIKELTPPTNSPVFNAEIVFMPGFSPDQARLDKLEGEGFKFKEASLTFEVFYQGQRVEKVAGGSRGNGSGFNGKEGGDRALAARGRGRGAAVQESSTSNTNATRERQKRKRS